MMVVHFRRIWADHRLLICLIAALSLATILSKPQVFPLEQIRSMELADLQVRFNISAFQNKSDYVNWYAMFIFLPELIGNSAAIVPAAVFGSYIVGGCLSKPVIMEQYAGTSRTLIAFRLYLTVIISGILFSLFLLIITLLVYGRECLQILGATAWPRFLPILGWRLFFDVSVFCLIALFAFISREMYISFCIGAMLAALTSILRLLQEELWWFPTYALKKVIAYELSNPQLLAHFIPSIAILIVTPMVGTAILRRSNLR